jgi:hypothetical protein
MFNQLMVLPAPSYVAPSSGRIPLGTSVQIRKAHHRALAATTTQATALDSKYTDDDDLTITHHHVGLSGDSAHAQVHSQPPPGTQADGRVRTTPPPAREIAHLHRFRRRHRNTHRAHEIAKEKEYPGLTIHDTVTSSTPTVPTSPRMSSAPSSQSFTSRTRTRSPSSVSAPSTVVASPLASPSSTTAPRR